MHMQFSVPYISSFGMKSMHKGPVNEIPRVA